MADKKIHDLTALAGALADNDEFAIYDASATSTKRATGLEVKTYATNVDINGLTGATPDVADSVPIYDASASANRKSTLTQVKALMTDVEVNGLTGATPEGADSIVIYDSSASANRKSTLTQVKPLMTDIDINGLTGASPAVGDSIAIYDLSATAIRKATLSDVLALGGGGGSGRYSQTFMPQQAGFPASNFAPLGSINGRLMLAYDASTDETAEWVLALPNAETFDRAQILFIMASATSGSVVFNVTIEAVTPNADTVDLDSATSFDTTNAATQSVPSTAGYLGAATVTLSNVDSMASLDYVRVRVTRDADHGSDTASGDMYLLAFFLFDEP